MVLKVKQLCNFAMLCSCWLSLHVLIRQSRITTQFCVITVAGCREHSLLHLYLVVNFVKESCFLFKLFIVLNWPFYNCTHFFLNITGLFIIVTDRVIIATNIFLNVMDLFLIVMDLFIVVTDVIIVVIHIFLNLMDLFVVVTDLLIIVTHFFLNVTDPFLNVTDLFIIDPFTVLLKFLFRPTRKTLLLLDERILQN